MEENEKKDEKKEKFTKLIEQINKYNKRYKGDFIKELKETHVSCDKHRMLVPNEEVCPECKAELKGRQSKL